MKKTKAKIKLKKSNPLRCGLIFGMWPGFFALLLGVGWQTFSGSESGWSGLLNVVKAAVLIFFVGFIIGLIYGFPLWITERKDPSDTESTEVSDSETQSEDEN